MASSDGLTGLANRRSFDQALVIERSRAQRTQTPLSLLFVHVDHLKLYNDLYGHQKGDDCLRAVAGAMAKNALRPADVSARYGGEEFAVLMPDTDHEVALKTVQRLRDSISRLRLIHGAPEAGALVTISIGVATQVPQEYAHPEFLLARADQARNAKTIARQAPPSVILLAGNGFPSRAIRHFGADLVEPFPI